MAAKAEHPGKMKWADLLRSKYTSISASNKLYSFVHSDDKQAIYFLVKQ